MSEGALTGLRVLDLSLELGGVSCTKLLADLGATVLMIEPPEGHPLRRRAPFVGGEPHPEKSALFLHYCANKGSVVLDFDSAEGRDRVLALAAGADLVVETFRPGRMAALGLHYEALRSRHPAAVLTSVTHFGQTGPYRDWEGEEIVDWALGGHMYFGGDAAREPLMVPFDQPQLNAGPRLPWRLWRPSTGRVARARGSTSTYRPWSRC